MRVNQLWRKFGVPSLVDTPPPSPLLPDHSITLIVKQILIKMINTVQFMFYNNTYHLRGHFGFKSVIEIIVKIHNNQYFEFINFN